MAKPAIDDVVVIRLNKCLNDEKLPRKANWIHNNTNQIKSTLTATKTTVTRL